MPAFALLLNWHMTGPEIATTCKTAIATADRRVNALVSHGQRTFKGVVLPLEDAGADLSDETAAATFLANVATEKSVRDAGNNCQNSLNDWYTRVQARPDLYKAVDAANKSGTAHSVYDRKITELWLTSLRRSGAGLQPAARKEFVDLTNELNKLENDFGVNLAEDKATIKLPASELGGVPADVLASYAKNSDRTYTVPVNESTSSFMNYATSEAARHEYYMTYNNRAEKNLPLLGRAIEIRDRLAHLMGYESWAAFVLDDRMAKTPQRVQSFLDNLDGAILPKAHEDLAELAKLKADETHDSNAQINGWDTAHYIYILNKTKYAVDANAVRQYFPVQHVVDNVLDIYHTLLGVNFARVTDESAWAPDVLEYDVKDASTGKLLGYTYFDLYPRPGKYDHFANFPILPYRRVSDAQRVPVSAIVGNWPRPGAGQPALLSHDDVVTFFHEFGHDMAALLTTAPYETLSAGFRQDFVEAPSQMLENFVWEPSILRKLSSNWKTGAPLPDDLIEKIRAARYVDYAYFTTRQIMLADVDMAYHTSGPHVDTTAVWKRISGTVSPLPLPDGVAPQASFGHIMGGYDAGYYGYLWSKVYAQDMFTAFEQGGLENPTVGARYRSTILAPARTYEPDVEVHNFLGRAMNPNAFYREFGIGGVRQ